MHTDTTTQPPLLRVRPIDHAEAAALLAGYANSQEWWLIICDSAGYRSIEPMLQRFYGCGDDQDLFVTVAWTDEVKLATVVARRRRMSAEKLRFELSKQGVTTSARELVEAGAFIRVADFNRAPAREFARTIGLDPEGDGLAMAI
jgi:hypothetical protein